MQRYIIPALNVNRSTLLRRIITFKLTLLLITTGCLYTSATANYHINFKNIYAAPRTITGKVIDKSGHPVEGASVKIQGTNRGVLTGTGGDFSIKGDIGEVLVISGVGFKDQTITIEANTDVVNITLDQDVAHLNEVVVVGYGSQKKANITGAISSVKMSEVVGSRPVTDLSKALQGATPGLQVTYGSGEPGATTAINIRGFTSINGGSPLILVDNVPIDDISTLNPNDIESISVLKDAASASIYGGRTAYGVVLITTKRPMGERKPTFEYSNNFAFTKAADIPKDASPLQTIQMFKDVGATTYFGENQDLDKWVTYLNAYNSNPSTYPGGMVMDGGKHYWLKANDKAENLFETGFSQTHNFAISGGSEKTSYRVAFGTTNEDGILATNKDSYKRYTVSSFISTDLAKWATAQVTINYTNSTKNFPLSSIPYGIFGNVAVLPSFAPVGYDTVNQRPYADPRNIVEQAGTDETKLSNIRPAARIILKPLTGLTITGEYTYNRSNSNESIYDKKAVFTNESTADLIYSTTTPSYTKVTSYTDYNSINLYAAYEKRLNNHNFNVMAGFNQETSYTELVNSKVLNMINDNLPSLSQGTGAVTSKDYYTEYAVRGFFGRIDYSYKNKYILEANGRYDGSSKFPPDHKYGFFPSFSAGWRVSEEGFMQMFKPILSELKLRASWGEVGNQTTAASTTYPYFTNNYPYIPQMPAINSTWVANNVALVTLGTPVLVSADFTWETVKTLNFGANVGLFKNKFLGSFDVYQRQTIGMLGPSAALPSVLGASAPLTNSANLETKGWEIDATWKDKVGKVGYSIGFNLYDSKAEITKYNNPAKLLSDANNKRWYVGQKVGEIWGYATDRYYTTDDFVPGSLDSKNMNGVLKAGLPYLDGNRKPNPGDILFKDLNGNDTIRTYPNAITPGDQKIIGDSSRHFQFAINGSVSWRNFDLSFFIQGIGKRDLWLNNQLTFPYSNTKFSKLFASQTDYWTANNPNAYYARFYDDGQYNTGYNRNVQTKYLLNGAYWRLKNITLGYTVPAHLLKKLSITKFRVFVSGENLFTHKNVSDGIDPEEADKAYGMGYPFMKMYSFGVNLNF